jgi:hypothetical protein
MCKDKIVRSAVKWLNAWNRMTLNLFYIIIVMKLSSILLNPIAAMP